MKITLTEEQTAAHDAIVEYVQKATAEKSDQVRPYITMGGYAGVGKTTVISTIVDTIREKNESLAIAFCAFTGKAASVLGGKLGALPEGDYCGTIHSLIYTPIVRNKIVIGWKKVDYLPYSLIVVDEASMVDGEIFGDLCSFKIPIIAVGDHGQLPPVNGKFNLMANPDIRLEKIHRQAEGNPIIRVSFMARKDCRVPEGEYGEGVRKILSNNIGITASRVVTENPNNEPLFLCGYNSTRVFLNKLIRQNKGIRSKEPIKGDKVICLRNNRTAGIYNGMTGVIEKIKNAKKDTYAAIIKMDGGDTYEGHISKYQFGQKITPSQWSVAKMGDLFDFGYCLTVHKAQGSEADDVVLIEQRLPEVDDYTFGRWLYTGTTRAKKKLCIIGGAKS